MKITVRHEPATDAGDPPGSQDTPDQACVWVVGDDGETLADGTRYLTDGESVEIDITAEGATSTNVGPVMGPVQPDVDQKADERDQAAPPA